MRSTRREFLKQAGLWVPALGLATRSGYAQRIPGLGGRLGTGGGPVPALVCSGKATANCAVTATTDLMNTTNATLLVVSLAEYNNCVYNYAPTDSMGNSWHFIPGSNSSNGVEIGGLWYAWDHAGPPPVVGPGHTFSYHDVFHPFVVAAFSGTKTTGDPLDGSATSVASSASSIQVPSLTPSQAGELGISGLAFSSNGGGSRPAVTAMTLVDWLYSSSSPGVGAAALAYVVQTAATAISPTWSEPLGPPILCGSLCSFKNQ